MRSEDIKAILLAYFRYKRQFDYVTTECGRFSSDVIASDGKKLIEVETKVSKSDLKRDIDKPKHRLYKAAKESAGRNHWIPHEFYIAVPKELEAYAIEHVSQWNDAYGVISIDDEKRRERCIGVAKRAKKLHDDAIHENVRMGMVARMSSEIATFWQWQVQYKNMVDDIKAASHAIIKIPDPFEPEEI